MLIGVISIAGLAAPSRAIQDAAPARIDLSSVVMALDGTGEGAIHLTCPTEACGEIALTLTYDAETATFIDVRAGRYWSAPPRLTIDTETAADGRAVLTFQASGVPNTIMGGDSTVFIVTFSGARVGSGAWNVVDAALTMQDGSSHDYTTNEGALTVLPADVPTVRLSALITVWLGPSALFKTLGAIGTDAPLPLLGVSADGAWAFVALPRFPQEPSIPLPLDNRAWINAADPAIAAFDGDVSSVSEVMPTNTPTATPTNTPTETPTPTFTPSDTPTPTFTPSDTPTFTPTPTPTPTETPTPTLTPSDTPTFTPTFTPTLSDAQIAATEAAIRDATATADAAPTRTQDALNTQLAQRLTEIAQSWTPTPSPSPTPTPTFTPSDTLTPSQTPTPSDTPTVTPIPTATPEPAFVTSSSAVNLRSGDGQNYSIVGTFPVGGEALVLGRSNLAPDWLYVLFEDGTRAWVSRSVVRIARGDVDETPLVEAGTNRVFTNTPSPLRTPTSTPFTTLDCGGLTPILPVNGFVNGIETFTWSGVNGINTYRIVIYDAADNIVGTQNVSGTTAQIDVSTTAIGPGISFSWQVLVLVNGLPVENCASFRITLPRPPF
jgi:hypothetical protein